MYAPGTAKEAATNLLRGVRQLYDQGARQFLVPLMPDLSLTPEALASSAAYRSAAAERTDEFNLLLRDGLQGIQLTRADLALLVFDVPAYLAAATPTMSDAGFDVRHACFDATAMSLCEDSNKFLFWDDKHPTTAAAALLADAFITGLRTETSMIPEPSTGLLIMLGLMGVVAARARHARQPSLTPI